MTRNKNISSINHELQLANDFVEYTDCNIFLTGKAGTGKTTFLHNLQENTAKRMIITAPTGVAAINAGGVTLHSFFQLPFGPFVPGSETYDRNRQRQFRFSKEKQKIIQSLDLLVIDEISMVRADLLDAVDAVLRRYRRNSMPFGGVQLLMIGDLHQLSPVAKHDEWQLLQQHYPSVYFFSSNALDRNQLVTIELKHIYRQSDSRFIKLLNQVRDNRLETSSIKDLNQRYIQDFTPEEDQGYITLTTHNSSAESLNQQRLQALNKMEHRFSAEIKGDFPEHIYPTPGTLLLKEGAQVMFVRNDASANKLYYNGKIGKIRKISTNSITVICPDTPKPIVVEPVNWENIKYTLNEENKEIDEEIIGEFEQYPLKLAWAITIHKSQGLTFEKAIIDSQAAFAHGQVYVALSRCKTLEGIVLSSPISPRGVETDEAVLSFDKDSQQNQPTEERLQAAKVSYQQKLLLDCFDFQLLRNRLNHLIRLLQGNAAVVQVSGISDISQLEHTARENIFIVSENFKRQLQTLFTENDLPESDARILERINKASNWFQDKFAANFGDSIEKLHVDTDNKELRKKITNAQNNFDKELTVKLAGVKCSENGFSPSSYLRAISTAEVDFLPQKEKKKEAPTYTEADVEHPELFHSLRDWRSQKAKKENLAHYQILHQQVLIQIVVCLPDNTADLLKIKGVGKKTKEKYGKELVALVDAYRQEHGIETVVVPPKPKNIVIENTQTKKEAPSSNTKQLSFDMFNKGVPIPLIAKERGLIQSTIEGHLSFFIEKGKIDINKLLSSEKQQVINKTITTAPNISLTELKQKLGADYSYSDIRMMLAHQKYLASK